MDPLAIVVAALASPAGQALAGAAAAQLIQVVNGSDPVQAAAAFQQAVSAYQQAVSDWQAAEKANPTAAS